MTATPLKPGSKIFVQHADGYYSIPWDATAGITILPGAGEGTITHGGKLYSIAATDPAARATLPNPTTYERGWTSLTLDGSRDSIQAALAVAGPGFQLTVLGPVLQHFTPPADPNGTITVQLPDSEDIAFQAGPA